MKKVLIALLFTFSFLFISSSVSAAESCTDDFYYWDTNADACIYKHGGYFDADTNECAYAFNVVASDLCPPIPTVTSTPTITPTPTRTPTPTPVRVGSEEQAVYNLNTGTLPKQVIQNPDSGLLERIFSVITQAFQTAVSNPAKLFAQSESIQQSTVSESLISPDDVPVIDRIKGFLGGPVGFYGVSLPKEVQSDTTIWPSEESYEKATFYQDIKVITGQ